MKSALVMLLVVGLARVGHTSYHEIFFRDLGELAFIAEIHDNGGEPGGTPLEEQRKSLEETVARSQGGWRAQLARFRAGKHPYPTTAALIRGRYDRANPNQLCVFLPLTAGKLCFTTRIPVVQNGLLALRFATAFRGLDAPASAGGSLRAALDGRYGLPMGTMRQFVPDVPPAELEAALAKARVVQFRQADRWSVPFMLLLLAGEHDRALAEALASYAGWMQKKGDALLGVNTEGARELNRPQMAASTLTLHLRELLAVIPDAKVAAMAAKVQRELAGLDSPYLSGIRDEVKIFRTELGAAGLR